MATAKQRAAEPGFVAYRAFVISYALLLPAYFYHRFVHSIVPLDSAYGLYQWITCILELYGAINVLLLGFVRFRKPWADALPMPPSLRDDDVDEERGILNGAASSGERGPFDVAILVPCYSEPDDVIFGTIEAALALSDPLASRVRVVLCDDGGRPERKARLEQFYDPARALYVSRPKMPNVPRHGKAGNLNYTLREVLYPSSSSSSDVRRSKGPPPNAVVVVFDCDMEAHGDFLSHTLPYLACEPRTALVQTPQHFYNVVPNADIFNHHNLTFYQAMQPGLDAWGATVCCGTNFVARANALHEVDYFPTESITEDYLLSLKLATAGWRVRFHAAVVSTGEAPEDLRQIFKQRNRWCCGCFQVFLHPEMPRWVIGLFRRSPIKAICWLNAPLSYMGTLLTVPLWAFVPALSLYADIHPVRALSPSFVLLWLSYFTLLMLVVEMMPSRLNRRAAAFLGSKCNSIFWYCFASALASAIIGRIDASKAKQFEVTEKTGRSNDADLRRAAAPLGNEATRASRASKEEDAAPLMKEEEEEPAAEEPAAAPSSAGPSTPATAPQQPIVAAAEAKEPEEPARDSSQVDVIFHQLVLSGELLFLIAGLLHRAFGPSRREGGPLGKGHWSDFHTWQQLGLVLVPAAWLLLNTIPNAMALAYAYMPHAHRVQSSAVKYALSAQSLLLFVITLAMVQSAGMHWLAHHHSYFHPTHGNGGVGGVSQEEEELMMEIGEGGGAEDYLYNGAGSDEAVGPMI